ncbi:MAG: Fe-S cluster assembly ATPase SufC, partial [Gammaproteobacteria bacterium]|nr:Fe-S cluster assembly ATPase SufC [Gammaproteobacteria bacterium]
MDSAALLQIEDLQVNVAGRKILNGLTLDVPRGQVHALMGPNGS